MSQNNILLNKFTFLKHYLASTMCQAIRLEPEMNRLKKEKKKEKKNPTVNALTAGREREREKLTSTYKIVAQML